MESATFPISPLLPAIADSLAAHPRLVLEAPPGAGKTTQVPLALLDAAWAEGRRIVMLEPRRVAARSAAAASVHAARPGSRAHSLARHAAAATPIRGAPRTRSERMASIMVAGREASIQASRSGRSV